MRPSRPLHHLILGQASMGIGVHVLRSALVEVLDKVQVEGTSTVLIRLELANRSLCRLSAVESNNTSAAGSATWFVLDFSLLNLANGCEKLDKIIVAG